MGKQAHLTLVFEHPLAHALVSQILARVPRKLLREIVGCEHTRTASGRKRKMSELFPTEAKKRAIAKSNRKRAEKAKLITHGIVYKLTAPSGKAYVGISKYGLSRRLLWHKSNYSCCHAIHAAINKYGLNAIKQEVLHHNVPLEDLPALEVLEIERQGTLQPNGYNLTKGGEVNPMDEEGARKKVSDAKTAYWKRAGVERRAKAAANMQKGDARERARENQMATRLKQAEERAAKLDPIEAEKYIAKYLEMRVKRQEAYRRKKEAAHRG